MRRRRPRKRPGRTRKALAVTLAAAHAAGNSGPGVEALVCPWSSSRHGVGEPVRGTTTTGRLRRADPWSSEAYPAAGLMPRACRSRTYAQSGASWWAWGAVSGKKPPGVEGNQSQAPATARASGAAGDVSPTMPTPPHANGNLMAAFFAIPGLLNAAVAERPPSVDGAADAVQGAPSGGNGKKEEEEGGAEEEEEEGESDNAVIMSLPTFQEQVGGSGSLGETGQTPSGRKDAEADGDQEEQGRRRDMYKIRSLLLQGQIAGLRQKLKERELDVRELRVLTGGRGQSKLRELGQLLKEARAECKALRAREKELAQDLALAQKESDVLRGDLLAGRKALADLNAYADSLRSRYTAEMVKLEASLAEMERELTRAEAAHMRERRDLLEREAVAVADGERFRNRTILLQDESDAENMPIEGGMMQLEPVDLTVRLTLGCRARSKAGDPEEIVKRRARETKLQQENARLTETVASVVALNDASGIASSGAAVVEPGVRGDAAVVGEEGDGGEAGTGIGVEAGVEGEAELASLRLENADLRSRLERLAETEAASEGRNDSDRRREAGDIVGGVTELGIGSEQPPSGGDPTVDETDRRGDVDLGASSALNGVEPVLPRRPIVPDVTLYPPSGAELLPPVPPRILSSIPDATLVSAVPVGAVEEKADVARVVADLREENGRLRKKLRAAAAAVEAREARANEEVRRAEDAEAELLRVRATVRGRVQALKVALEEAEAEADRAVRDKEGHMRQWAEDVDALRAQLIAERAVWEEDRDQLDSQIVDLEEEVRRLKESYRRSKATSPRAAKQRTRSSGYNGERRRAGDEDGRSRPRPRSRSRSDVGSAPGAVGWNARDEGLRERRSAELRESDEQEDGFGGGSGRIESVPDPEWSRAVQMMENLY